MALKTADEIIGPGLDKFYELQPKSKAHINLREGTYWHVFGAFRAQAALALQRQAALVKSNTLECEDAELQDYIRSEFTDIPNSALIAQSAVGELTLTRATALTSGDIPKGSKFYRPANDSTQLSWTATTYETLVDVHMDVGQLTSAAIPIRATSERAQPNHVVLLDSVPHGVVPIGRTLFDPTLTVDDFAAAGGASPASDAHLRTFATTFAKGQFGPTDDAAIFGALAASGVRHTLSFDDPTAGVMKMIVADESWASSDHWIEGIQKQIIDQELQGFGCRIQLIGLRNKIISVEANVVLRDWNFVSDTVEIDEAIKKAVREYFDDRPDWNVWKLRPLRGVITGAHPKILKCSSAVVKDVNGDTEDEIVSPDFESEQFHMMLAQNAVTSTYSGPS